MPVLSQSGRSRDGRGEVLGAGLLRKSGTSDEDDGLPASISRICNIRVKEYLLANDVDAVGCCSLLKLEFKNKSTAQFSLFCLV